MNNLEIIKDVETKLSPDLLNSFITYKNEKMLFKDFLENVFVNAIKGNNVDNIASYIETTFGSLVKKENIVNSERTKEKYITSFLNSSELVVDEVRLSEEIYLNVKDFLLKNIQDDMTIKIGPNNKSIEDAYRIVINNYYQAPTMNDKIELCENLASYIALDILESVMDGMDISVQEYLINVLPTKMVNATEVLIDEKRLSVEDVVKKIVDHQREIINEQIRIERQKKEDEFNRTSENPSLISELTLTLNSDKYEVTAELPIIEAGSLDEKEINNLVNLASTSVFAESIFYEEQFNNIKQAIRKCHTMSFLEKLETEFKDLLNEPDCVISEELKSSILELIEEKRKNLIKIETNKEEEIDAILGRINEIKNKISTFTSPNEFSEVMPDIVDISMAINDWQIKDPHLKASFDTLKIYFNQKYLIADGIKQNDNKVQNRLINTLDDYIIEIKSLSQSLEFDKDPVYLASSEIRLNLKVEECKSYLEKLYQERIITGEEKNLYLYRINGMTKEKNKGINPGL